MSTITAPVTHPVKLTERINRIEPSATMAVVAEADKLRQQGIDVVDFGAGEPTFRPRSTSRMQPSPPFRRIFRSTPLWAVPPN